MLSFPSQRRHGATLRGEPARCRLLFCRLLFCGLLCCCSLGCQPLFAGSQELDLLTVSPEDHRFRRVYGSVGRGDLGVPVAGGHDCDGDGFLDYAVAFLQADAFGRRQAGEVDLVFGDGAFGGFLDTAAPSRRLLRLAGAGEQEAAGNEIWMDDVTGDGLGDLLVGRQNFTPAPGRPGAGALSIVVGSPALRARAATLRKIDLRDPPEDVTVMTFVGAAAFDRLGIWVRSGDIDGDGVADLVIGADQADRAGEPNRGEVYVVRGGPHLAADATVDFASFGETPLAGHLARLEPPPGAAGFHFGATCQITDLDGNGRGEVLAAATLNRAGAALPAAGAPPQSAASFGGAPHGRVLIAWDENFPAPPWPAGYEVDLARPPGDVTLLVGAAGNVNFGEEILGGGDFDADGRADLFVGDLAGDGSPDGNRRFSGLGYVFYDAATLRGRQLSLDRPPADLRQSRILGPTAGAIGTDTAAVGDFDGDGVDDLAVASPHASPSGRTSAGAVHVLYGRSGGWPETIDTWPAAAPAAEEVRTVEIQGAAGTMGEDIGDTLAYSAAAADLDADGRTDLMINEMLGNGLAPSAVDTGNLLLISGRALDGGGGCLATSQRLCLGGRFSVEVGWRDFEGRTGTAETVPFSSDDSGLFWFFHEDNWELLVKVLDGCFTNGHFWVFVAAVTDVEFTLRVTDTATGTLRSYKNPLGNTPRSITDTSAFRTCTD